VTQRDLGTGTIMVGDERPMGDFEAADRNGQGRLL